MYDQSLGEIPMVEDELRKAAGTEENVDESLAAGPTQQVRFSFDVSTQKLSIDGGRGPHSKACQFHD